MTEKHRRIKVVIAKTGLDGHWRGVQAVATTLRNAGMEVVYVGMSEAEAVARIAIQEDADVIGLNVGASYQQIEALIEIMKARGLGNVLLIVGGVIPLVDIPKLKDMGVHGVFPPGSKLEDIAAFVREHVRLPH
ncbi:MAG: cobalamin-dependent protein [Proteobacteria bacterium]|nr:cobalamin-dependent protein [Pseudomonadota bacterium]